MLRVTQAVTSQKIRPVRLIAASLMLALCSLLIFVPNLNSALLYLIKILTAFVASVIAFGYKSMSKTAFNIFCFFVISMLFSGAAQMVSALTKSKVFVFNGVVYIHIQPVLLAVCLIAAYLLTMLAGNRFKRSFVDKKYYDVKISCNGKTKSFKAFVDSGNTLREPFLGTPAAVVGIGDISPVLGGDLKDALTQYYSLTPEKTADSNAKIMLLPYKTVGGSSLIPAFRPESAKISEQGGEYELEDILIAVSPQKIGGTGYEMLLNPEIIKQKI